MTAVYKLVEALLAWVLPLARANPLRRNLHRASPAGPGNMRSTIDPERRASFQNDAAVPENEVDIVEVDAMAEPPEPIVADIPAMEGIIQDAPAPRAPLMGSLHGILDYDDE